MSLPAYAEYKDSGVAWLGDVPKHWPILGAKNVFYERNTKASKGDEQLTASQKYGVIPQKMFADLEGVKVMQVILGHDILKRAEIDDFVISMRSFQGGLEYCGYSGSVSSAYVPIYSKMPIESFFYKYLSGL
jgi:type I restriction enzyme S subunit